jgi:hypothetical protein
MKFIEDEQIKILKKIKIFFSQSKRFNEEISRLDLFYLSPFGQSKGAAKLISLFNRLLAIKIYLIATLKDIYQLFRTEKFRYIKGNDLTKYKTVVVNWASVKDFDKKGNFYDKHFNIRSDKCDDVHWILIYLNDKVPLTLQKNITLIYNKKKFINLSKILNIFIQIIFRKKTFRFINQELSYMTQLANFLEEKTSSFIDKNITKVIMPYEGQPFQNTIFDKVKKINKKVQTVGYIHSYPIGLPSNLFKRNGHPKQLIVSSESQKFCMNNYLGWKKKEIKILPSARLLKKNNLKMSNKIFLPIKFNNINLITSSFKSLLKKEKFDLSDIEIRNHPSCYKSIKHMKLINSLKNIIKHFKPAEKKLKNLSIFIGPTGSVIEALVRNVNVYHICEIPELESYQKKIWKYIETNEINNNVFMYNLLSRNKLIKFGKHINLYKKYFY